MAEIVVAVILFLVSAAAFTASFMYFREKGFLLNNAYLYASKQDRKIWIKNHITVSLH